MAPIDYRDPAGPTLSRGPSFLYVAPLAYEDLLKLGFSRDPLVRLQSMHPRYFEAFDLERAMLVATENVRDARALELRLRRLLVDHNAPAPLTMRAEAGGFSEWYRGAYSTLEAAVEEFSDAGYTVHAPAFEWFRAAHETRTGSLYAWTEAMLSCDELDGLAGATPAQRTVRDALDAFAAFGIELTDALPPAVLHWYRRDVG